MLLAAACLTQTAEAACRDEATPFVRGCRALELTALYHVEAWDENQSRDTVAGVSLAFTYAFRDGWTLVGEAVGYRVDQPAPIPRLGGLLGLVRRRFYERGDVAVFADAGLGASYADAPVPTRGTRFNYLLQAGVGMTHRLTPRFGLVGHIRHLHLSNNGLAGSSRNPDIQSLGVQVGVLMRLGGRDTGD